MHGLMVGGAVAAIHAAKLQIPQQQTVMELGPLGAFIMQVMAMCPCDDPECAGLAAPEELTFVIGYEGIAAIVGQATAWIDDQPTHIQDQCARIIRDAYNGTIEAMKGNG